MEVAGYSKITGKQLGIFVAWLGSGMVLGLFTERIVFPLWSKVTLVPFGHWLDAHKTNNNHALLSSLLALWIGAPGWGLGAIVGVLRGLFAKKHLVLHLLLFGIGFSLVPLALHTYFYFALPDLQTIGWETFSVGLMICVGLVSHRLAHRKTNKALQGDVLK